MHLKQIRHKFLANDHRQAQLCALQPDKSWDWRDTSENPELSGKNWRLGMEREENGEGGSGRAYAANLCHVGITKSALFASEDMGFGQNHGLCSQTQVAENRVADSTLSAVASWLVLPPFYK